MTSSSSSSPPTSGGKVVGGITVGVVTIAILRFLFHLQQGGWTFIWVGAAVMGGGSLFIWMVVSMMKANHNAGYHGTGKSGCSLCQDEQRQATENGVQNK